MATLKYKSGNTWQELSLGSGLDEYPIGSFYFSPSVLTTYGLENGTGRTTSYRGYSCLLTTLKSPASLFGGAWTKVTNSQNTQFVRLGQWSTLSASTYCMPPTLYESTTYTVTGGMSNGCSVSNGTLSGTLFDKLPFEQKITDSGYQYGWVFIFNIWYRTA